MGKINVEPKVIFEGETWESGTGTMVITIGKKIREFYNIEIGDRIQVALIDVKKKVKSEIVDQRENKYISEDDEDAEDFEEEVEEKAKPKKKRGKFKWS